MGLREGVGDGGGGWAIIIKRVEGRVFVPSPMEVGRGMVTGAALGKERWLSGCNDALPRPRDSARSLGS